MYVTQHKYVLSHLWDKSSMCTTWQFSRRMCCQRRIFLMLFVGVA